MISVLSHNKMLYNSGDTINNHKERKILKSARYNDQNIYNQKKKKRYYIVPDNSEWKKNAG